VIFPGTACQGKCVISVVKSFGKPTQLATLAFLQLLFSQAIITDLHPMDNKHHLPFFSGSSRLSTAPHLATRILILKNGESRSVDIRFVLEKNT